MPGTETENVANQLSVSSPIPRQDVWVRNFNLAPAKLYELNKWHSPKVDRLNIKYQVNYSFHQFIETKIIRL